ncbi:hypothetical protein ACFPRL_17865 [Pseudoclavibacter helvolus]
MARRSQFPEPRRCCSDWRRCHSGWHSQESPPTVHRRRRSRLRHSRRHWLLLGRSRFLWRRRSAAHRPTERLDRTRRQRPTRRVSSSSSSSRVRHAARTAVAALTAVAGCRTRLVPMGPAARGSAAALDPDAPAPAAEAPEPADPAGGCEGPADSVGRWGCAGRTAPAGRLGVGRSSCFLQLACCCVHELCPAPSRSSRSRWHPKTRSPGLR